MAITWFVGLTFRPFHLSADEKNAVDDGTGEDSQTEVVKRQHEEYLKSMRERAATMKVSARGVDTDGDLIAEPLMRWTNLPMRVADTTLWGWTSEGRLIGVCKIARLVKQFPQEKPAWIYIFTSLSPELVTAKLSDGKRFLAEKPGFERKPISNVAAAAESKVARLRQMKEITNRFEATISNDINKSSEELRILPRPIYRYEDPPSDLLDGAIFGFVRGTAPNALLIIELRKANAGAPEWTFACAGMTTQALSIRLDDKEVWNKPLVLDTGDYGNWTWFYAD
jgi:hypothetical protein